MTMAGPEAVEQAVASSRVAHPTVGHTADRVLDREILLSTEGLAETDITVMEALEQALGVAVVVEVLETTTAAVVAVTAVVLQGASIINQEQAAAATLIVAPRQHQLLHLTRPARLSKSKLFLNEHLMSMVSQVSYCFAGGGRGV